jgi:hypothetical protein
MNWPDDNAYELVKAEIEKGKPLTHAMVGDVFGPDYWCLTVQSLLDAGDAARAIQGSIARLSGRVDAKEDES